MSGQLQHTLLNLEIAPPESAWAYIALQLDQDPQHSTPLEQHLYNLEVMPPPGTWQQIAAGLDAAPAQRSSVTIPFRKLAAAAVIAGILLLASWFWLNNTTGSRRETVQRATQQATGAITRVKEQVPVAAEAPAKNAGNLSGRNVLILSSENNGNATARRNAALGYATAYAPFTEETDLPTITAESISAVTTTSSPANVGAPLIRDANGRIIWDTDLLLSDNNNYVTVTGPNGEQTRISTKFLPMLSSLNSTSDNNEYRPRSNNNDWQTRFQDWRNRLLQQSSFVPSATNFLDILELRDMLQEN